MKCNLKEIKGVLRGMLRTMYFKVENYYFIRLYQRKHVLERLREKISRKDQINVMFFAMNASMWKSDELFIRLLESDRFNPFVVSYLLPWQSLAERKKIQDATRRFFTEKGYPYYDCYNFETDEWFDVQTLSPDIVFYTQKYNSGYKKYLMEALYKQALFAYVPYSFVLEDMKCFNNLLMSNIAWKMFYPTIFQKQLEEKYADSKGVNVEVVGSMIQEEFARGVKSFPWKQKNPEMKRIVWAPHHTVRDTDVLKYSTFLYVADFMLEMVHKYRDRVQVAFKPHPMLKEALYSREDWGKERTDRYYAQWDALENTVFADGDYIDLFLTSDALIHDSSSFTGEYLYTDKPCMYLVRGDHKKYLSDFGKECFDQHYHAFTTEDIERFIVDVVLEGKDVRYDERRDFREKFLLAPNGVSPSMNIYNIMLKEFEAK